MKKKSVNVQKMATKGEQNKVGKSIYISAAQVGHTKVFIWRIKNLEVSDDQIGSTFCPECSKIKVNQAKDF